MTARIIFRWGYQIADDKWNTKIETVDVPILANLIERIRKLEQGNSGAIGVEIIDEEEVA